MVWVWCGVAFVATVFLRLALRDTFTAPVLSRTNYAGRTLATGGGLIAVVGCIATVGLAALVDATSARLFAASVVAVVGFAGVGLFDDLVGSHSARGIRGHICAAAKGQLTSGATKLVAGVALGAIVSLVFRGDEARLVDTVVIAGAANVGNLFDLAPARAVKVAVIAMAALLGVSHADAMAAPVLVVAAFVALARAELREDLMLGDTGANALGAVVGLAALTAAPNGAGPFVAAGVVVVINAAGEFVSFGRVIDRVAPLRVLDRLGRRK